MRYCSEPGASQGKRVWNVVAVVFGMFYWISPSPSRSGAGGDMAGSVGDAREPRAFGSLRRLATVGLIEGRLLGQGGRDMSRPQRESGATGRAWAASCALGGVPGLTEVSRAGSALLFHHRQGDNGGQCWIGRAGVTCVMGIGATS